MSKDELITLLKEYKENKAKLNIRLKELKTARIKLKNCNSTYTNMTSNYGINQDIHSKNQISNKVLNRIEKNETKREELQEEIKNLEAEVRKLRDKVDAVNDRLEGLKYREKEMLCAYYIDGRTYQDIGNNLYFKLFNQTRDGDTIKDIVEKAVKKMLNL